MGKKIKHKTLGVALSQTEHAELRMLAHKLSMEHNTDMSVSELVRSALCKCYGIGTAENSIPA